MTSSIKTLFFASNAKGDNKIENNSTLNIKLPCGIDEVANARLSGTASSKLQNYKLGPYDQTDYTWHFDQLTNFQHITNGTHKNNLKNVEVE